MGYVDGMSLYQYVKSNPGKYTDAQGFGTPGAVGKFFGYTGGTVVIDALCRDIGIAVLPEAGPPWRMYPSADVVYNTDAIAILGPGGKVRYYKIPDNVDITITCKCENGKSTAVIHPKFKGGFPWRNNLGS